MSSRIVTGRWADAADTPCRGTVEFRPVPRLIDVHEETIRIAVPIIRTLDLNGSIEVELLCTDTPGIEPEEWVWRVSEDLAGLPRRARWFFQLPSDETPLDLTSVAPRSTQWAGVVSAGPIGPRGPEGPQGPMGAWC